MPRLHAGTFLAPPPPRPRACASRSVGSNRHSVHNGVATRSAAADKSPAPLRVVKLALICLLVQGGVIYSAESIGGGIDDEAALLQAVSSDEDLQIPRESATSSSRGGPHPPAQPQQGINGRGNVVEVLDSGSAASETAADSKGSTSRSTPSFSPRTVQISRTTSSDGATPEPPFEDASNNDSSVGHDKSISPEPTSSTAEDGDCREHTSLFSQLLRVVLIEIAEETNEATLVIFGGMLAIAFASLFRQAVHGFQKQGRLVVWFFPLISLFALRLLDLQFFCNGLLQGAGMMAGFIVLAVIISGILASWWGVLTSHVKIFLIALLLCAILIETRNDVEQKLLGVLVVSAIVGLVSALWSIWRGKKIK